MTDFESYTLLGSLIVSIAAETTKNSRGSFGDFGIRPAVVGS